jgi:hypothetical protein
MREGDRIAGGYYDDDGVLRVTVNLPRYQEPASYWTSFNQALERNAYNWIFYALILLAGAYVLTLKK